MPCSVRPDGELSSGDPPRTVASDHLDAHPEGVRATNYKTGRMNRFKTSKFKNTTPKIAKKDVSRTQKLG